MKMMAIIWSAVCLFSSVGQATIALSTSQGTYGFLERDPYCKMALDQVLPLKYETQNGTVPLVRVGLTPDELMGVFSEAGVSAAAKKKVFDFLGTIMFRANSNGALRNMVETAFGELDSLDGVKPIFCMGMNCSLPAKAGAESVQFPFNYIFAPLSEIGKIDVKKYLSLPNIPHPNGGMSRIEPILLDRPNVETDAEFRIWVEKFIKDTSDFSTNRTLSEWIAKNNLLARAGQNDSIHPLFKKYIRINGNIIFIEPKFYFGFIVAQRFSALSAADQTIKEFTSNPNSIEPSKAARAREALETIVRKAGQVALTELNLNEGNVLDWGNNLLSSIQDFNGKIKVNVMRGN